MNVIAPYVVYLLLDPRLNGFEAVRYVGSTMFPLEFRLQNHIDTSKSGDKRKVSKWIRQLARCKLKPSITLVKESLTRRAMFALEYETIAIYRRFGAQLLNMTNQDQKGVLQVVV